VAAAFVGTDRGAAERLPDTAGLANEVILQRGHNIDYGGSIVQNVTITGAKLIEIGAATETRPYQLEHALTDRSAAALFVVSHHTVQTGMIGLSEFCRICHDRGVPVIVDAAAEPDPRHYLSAGADLVISSMQKPFRGLTASVIAGRLDLIRACVVQEKGIARAMKCSKEAVASTIAALEKWSRSPGKAMYADLDGRLQGLADCLRHLPGLRTQIVPDAVSGLFSRLHLHFDPKAAPVTAQVLAQRLAAHRPSIHLRTSEAELGILQVDLRHVSDEAVDLLVRTLVDSYDSGDRVDAADASTDPQDFPLPPRHGAP
jgi:L-seryl-tRNA(Ser) seleniumtransferase